MSQLSNNLHLFMLNPLVQFYYLVLYYFVHLHRGILNERLLHRFSCLTDGNNFFLKTVSFNQCIR